MTESLRQLHIDHQNVAKLLNVLREQLQSAMLEQRVDYELLQDAMRYMTQYPDIAHHPAEDLIFDLAALRTPAAKEITAELKREHAALATKGGAFLDALRRVVDGAMVERDLITSRGRDYVEFLTYHMKKEEDHIFPLAEHVLLEEDWQIVGDYMNDMQDPLFGAVVEDDYQRIYRVVTQDKR